MIKYFFRGTPDGYIFPNGSRIHWIMMAFILMGVELIIKYRNELREDKYNKIFKVFMITMLSIQQIILYLWYEFSGYFTIHESLPLYNCRVAIIFTIFALISNKDFYKNICCYWGIIGAISALAFPTVDPFKFPHYTGLSFFLGHALLLWSGIYLLVVERHDIGKESLFSVLIFTNVYHSIIFIFNILTSSNYCYLNSPPFSIGIIDNMNQLIYTFTAFNGFNIFFMIFYLMYKILRMYRLKRKDVMKCSK
ncbi:TIGR02206 family membrane protein [Anaerosalibacter bizertensis]|uniref:TIGR02206 family membrane protein n=1 Tax=Anaerosalibacter bizertensis TaxID=932217 RepID=A0A844FIB6_9FIRM|nr:TIGR02206 family membrane protein [Anaerosalibacter bizertensis]MSS43754.1 TIGR02206 family membrane protein [Anaerosalibacter bizertensis]